MVAIGIENVDFDIRFDVSGRLSFSLKRLVGKKWNIIKKIVQRSTCEVHVER